MKSILGVLSLLLITSFCFAQSINLKLNLEKGQSYKQVSVSKINMNQNIGGQSFDIQMEVLGTMSFLVADIIDEVYQMKVNYEKMTLKVGSPMGNQTFDSESENENDPMSKMLSALKLTTLEIKIDQQGQVIEIKNTDQMFAALEQAAQGMDPMQKQQMIGQLKQSFGEDALKSSLQATTSIFPKTSVNVGDVWTVDTNVTAPIQMNQATQFQLKEMTPEYCILDAQVTFQTPENSDYVEMNGMKMKYDMKGSGTASLKVACKTGWVIESKNNQDITGKITAKDVPQMPDGMTIEMKIKSETAVTDK